MTTLPPTIPEAPSGAPRARASSRKARLARSIEQGLTKLGLKLSESVCGRCTAQDVATLAYVAKEMGKLKERLNGEDVTTREMRAIYGHILGLYHRAERHLPSRPDPQTASREP